MVRDKQDDLVEDELKTIHKPCLLIWGREDQVVPLNIGERLASDLPQLKTHRFRSSAGHLLPEEKPETVSQLIQDFFKKS